MEYVWYCEELDELIVAGDKTAYIFNDTVFGLFVMATKKNSLKLCKFYLIGEF